MIESQAHHDPIAPPPRWQFALMLLGFGAMLAAGIVWRAPTLWVISIVLGSLVLIDTVTRLKHLAQQGWGVILPLLLGGPAAAVLYGEVPNRSVALGLVGALGGLAIVCLGSKSLSDAVFGAWMKAAMPIGRVVNYIILGAVYYLVMTPVGLLLRASGRDSMHRRLDAGAQSYWQPREAPGDRKRYFRQF